MRTIQVSSTFCMFGENSHLLPLLCVIAGEELTSSSLCSSCKMTGRALGDDDDSPSPVCKITGRELTETFALLLRVGSPANGEARTRKMNNKRRRNMVISARCFRRQKTGY
jgi:hypothetical protein